MRPKKSYGQNFLINESVSQRIIETFLEKKVTENVLEVGPGKGALTKYLIKQEDINFKAVEADWDMIHHLQQEFGMSDQTLIQADFLKLPLEGLFDGEEYAVIGNFPYNISSQILFKVDKYRDKVPFVVGMFQKELAQRLAAGPGSKTYGVISVLLQATYDIKIEFHVSPGSFFPAPKVTSSIISLQRKEDYSLPCDRKVFRAVVKSAFNQRRKMLRNTLKPFIKDESLFGLEIMTQRPEQLSLGDYYSLTNTITNQEA